MSNTIRKYYDIDADGPYAGGKEQLPQELVERFESVVSKIGLIPKTAEQCARICKEEMEKEAVAVLDWLLNMSETGTTNYDENFKIEMIDGCFYWDIDTDGDHPIEPSELYRIFKTPITESKNK